VQTRKEGVWRVDREKSRKKAGVGGGDGGHAGGRGGDLGAESAASAGAEAGCSGGATAPPQSDTTAKIITTVNTVICRYGERLKRGGWWPDLTREEFRIFDDNIEQRISLFSVEAFPLSAVVLIDNDLKGKDSEMVESSLKSIVGGLSLTDEAFVCRFDVNFHPGKGLLRIKTNW